MERAERRRGGDWRWLLRHMRLPLCAFAALALLVALGLLMLRAALLKNAYETGTALARSYAAEASGDLNVYETLLDFGTSALDSRLMGG